MPPTAFLAPCRGAAAGTPAALPRATTVPGHGGGGGAAEALATRATLLGLRSDPRSTVRQDVAGATAAAAVAVAVTGRRGCRLQSRRRGHGARLQRAAEAGGVGEVQLEEEAGAEEAEAAQTGTPTTALREELLELAAVTSRGQNGEEGLRQRCEEVIARLEAANPTEAPACSPLLEGRWRLVYATEDPTRCSPFFWALRDRMKDVQDPNPLSRALFGGDDLLENTLAFTDGVPIKTVGLATQELTGGKLVNQVVVGVFPTGESKMTTTCRYAPDEAEPGVLAVTVEKTQVLGASVAASLLDQLDFPSGDFLGESAAVQMQVTYLDERLRIVRDGRRRGACFAFGRI